MLKGYLQFIKICITGKSITMVNTSMDKKAHLRDSLFILIASFFRKEIYVFVHGWDQLYFQSLSIQKLKQLFKAKKIFVLSNDFKNELIKKGYKGSVVVETTVVDNKFMEAFPTIKTSNANGIRFLFLARLEKEKGILLVLEAFRQLNSLYKNISLDIAGFGSMEKQIKQIIDSSGLTNITYHGLVKGDKKIKLFQSADVYLLPTYHGEGMPIGVLEAMAAGLSVITTKAGALGSFFQDNVMGFQMKNATIKDLLINMESAIQNPVKVIQTGAFNHEFARDQFTVAKVISRLEKEILQA